MNELIHSRKVLVGESPKNDRSWQDRIVSSSHSKLITLPILLRALCIMPRALWIMPGQCDNSEFDCYNLSHCPGIMHNDRINHNARNINTVLPVEANLDDFTMTETPESGWFYSRTLPISERSRGHLYSQNGGRGFTMTETPDRADFKTEHFRSLHFFIILLFCVF